jgi:hypothetical protein
LNGLVRGVADATTQRQWSNPDFFLEDWKQRLQAGIEKREKQKQKSKELWQPRNKQKNNGK